MKKDKRKDFIKQRNRGNKKPIPCIEKYVKYDHNHSRVLQKTETKYHRNKLHAYLRKYIIMRDDGLLSNKSDLFKEILYKF